jgi:photosystem II stability/assembly factor-like uncharacterized protein
MMRTRPISLFCGLAAIALAAGSCKTKGGGSYSGGGGGGGGSSSWLVGSSGTMIRVSHKDPRDLGEYNLGSRPDLFAIACRGDHEAWVTGAAGTILRTFDGGAHWDAIAGGGSAALRSVAVAESGGVYVAGDQGTLLFSADSGQRWVRISGGGAASFTGVATTALGDVALLTAADGSLWRYERAGNRLTAVVNGGPALHAVSIAADGSRAIAVGDRGLFLASADGGRTFAARALETSRALYNVWTSESVDRAIAVGEAGVVVDVAGGAVHIAEHGGGALRAIHLTSTDGTGLAVGDGGSAWLTGDAGKTWSPVDVETTADLTGVDALFGEPHL